MLSTLVKGDMSIIFDKVAMMKRVHLKTFDADEKMQKSGQIKKMALY